MLLEYHHVDDRVTIGKTNISLAYKGNPQHNEFQTHWNASLLKFMLGFVLYRNNKLQRYCCNTSRDFVEDPLTVY